MKLSRRGFLALLGAALLRALLPPARIAAQPVQASLTDQTGVFPFDLGATLLERPAAQVIHYDSKIFRVFLPVAGR
jgi:hypothetical protein